MLLNALIRLLLLATLVALLANRTAAQEVQLGQGLLCDTQSEVETVLSLATNGATPQAALDQVNGEAKPPKCAVLRVAYVLGNKVGSAKNFDIYEVLVVGVVTPTGVMQVAPSIQFTPFKAEGREV